jgi:hypothetical protein
MTTSRNTPTRRVPDEGPAPDLRTGIVTAFAGWTALSALRSGSPVKSRARIYPLLRLADFDALLRVPPRVLTADHFDEWHAAAIKRLCREDDELCVGWAAKLVNVYLKTTVYVGRLGPPELIEFIHPPIDGGLWAGLNGPLARRPAIRARTHGVRRINQITTYTQYLEIIEGCRELARELGCRLIEVEQFWQGADNAGG